MIRLRPSGILPLELWDLLTPDGRILWEHMRLPTFGEVLHAAISQAWHGTAATRSEGALGPALSGFHTLHLSGGGGAAVLAAMRSGPWSETLLAKEPAFAASAGGQALLAAHGLSGWVLDVGQSGLKISSQNLRLHRPRDWTRLSLRDDDDPAVNMQSQRLEMRRFLANLLMEMHQATGCWPAGLVAGLPSRLDDQGVPEGSSYIGMSGDATLLEDAVKMAGMPAIPLFVLNDAELAAVSARQEIAGAHSALVLTIGFGVGGALICSA